MMHSFSIPGIIIIVLITVGIGFIGFKIYRKL